jgi:hypothetical protein
MLTRSPRSPQPGRGHELSCRRPRRPARYRRSGPPRRGFPSCRRPSRRRPRPYRTQADRRRVPRPSPRASRTERGNRSAGRDPSVHLSESLENRRIALGEDTKRLFWCGRRRHAVLLCVPQGKPIVRHRAIQPCAGRAPSGSSGAGDWRHLSMDRVTWAGRSTYRPCVAASACRVRRPFTRPVYEGGGRAADGSTWPVTGSGDGAQGGDDNADRAGPDPGPSGAGRDNHPDEVMFIYFAHTYRRHAASYPEVPTAARRAFHSDGWRKRPWT